MLEEGKKKESACSTSYALLYTKVNDIAPDFTKIYSTKFKFVIHCLPIILFYHITYRRNDIYTEARTLSLIISMTTSNFLWRQVILAHIRQPWRHWSTNAKREQQQQQTNPRFFTSTNDRRPWRQGERLIIWTTCWTIFRERARKTLTLVEG